MISKSEGNKTKNQTIPHEANFQFLLFLGGRERDQKKNGLKKREIANSSWSQKNEKDILSW